MSNNFLIFHISYLEIQIFFHFIRAHSTHFICQNWYHGRKQCRVQCFTLAAPCQDTKTSHLIHLQLQFCTSNFDDEMVSVNKSQFKPEMVKLFDFEKQSQFWEIQDLSLNTRQFLPFCQRWLTFQSLLCEDQWLWREKNWSSSFHTFPQQGVLSCYNTKHLTGELGLELQIIRCCSGIKKSRGKRKLYMKPHSISWAVAWNKLFCFILKYVFK